MISVARRTTLKQIGAAVVYGWALSAWLRPGHVTTDLPAHANTRSGQDFVIMTQNVS